MKKDEFQKTLERLIREQREYARDLQAQRLSRRKASSFTILNSRIATTKANLKTIREILALYRKKPR
jgi:hypothetical protein